MACCAIALALVYQLIDGWRRLRAWFGLGVEDVLPRPSPLRARLRVGMVAALGIEAAIAGGLAFQHRHHLIDEGARLVFVTAGVAADLCRLPTTTTTTITSRE